MNLWRLALAQRLLQRFQGQRLRQMLTQFPPSYHSGEDIHEQNDIDEVPLETDIGNIANPDLIASTDVKRLQVIAHPQWSGWFETHV